MAPASLSHACLVVSSLLVIACPALGQTPGFFGVGVPSDAVGGTSCYAISANGLVAAGQSYGLTTYPGFTWTVAGGRNDFGTQAGLPANTGARGISADGSVVVGRTASRAFVYRGPGTYQAIAPIGGYTATAAAGVSGDGSIVVGNQFVPQTFASQSFRWTSQTGVQNLGVARPGDAYSGTGAISRDGSTIVGESFGGLDSVAYTWRQSTGMIPLPALPGSTSSRAKGVNLDGSIVVGVSGSTHAVAWRDGQLMDLGLPSGFSGYGQANAVNDLGSVVVGYAAVGPNQFASIWTPSFGMEFLSDYLVRNGIEIPSGWTLLNATAVSADGLTIAGWGSNALTGSEGFVVTIPAPSSLLALSVGAILATRRRRE